MNSKPRLELTLGPNPPGGFPGFTIALTLINETAQSIDAIPSNSIVPRLLNEAGKPVTFSDFRNIAGYAPPQVPQPPGEPIRPGERRILERYIVTSSDKGWAMSVPYGGAQLTPGRYHIHATADLGAETRAQWMDRYVTGSAARPGSVLRHETPAHAAERASAAFATHWSEVASYWTGHLESNRLELTIPTHR